MWFFLLYNYRYGSIDVITISNVQCSNDDYQVLFQCDFISSNETECNVDNAVIVECSKWSYITVIKPHDTYNISYTAWLMIRWYETYNTRSMHCKNKIAKISILLVSTVARI